VILTGVIDLHIDIPTTSTQQSPRSLVYPRTMSSPPYEDVHSLVSPPHPFSNLHMCTDVSMPSAPASIDPHLGNDVSMTSAPASAHGNTSSKALSADDRATTVTRSEVKELRSELGELRSEIRSEIHSLKDGLQNMMGGLERTMRLLLDEARRAREESDRERERYRV
jgi:hypothetical protein